MVAVGGDERANAGVGDETAVPQRPAGLRIGAAEQGSHFQQDKHNRGTCDKSLSGKKALFDSAGMIRLPFVQLDYSANARERNNHSAPLTLHLHLIAPVGAEPGLNVIALV